MNLTSRELEACKLFAWGASDKEVAIEMNISPTTAHTYRGNILEKTGSHNVSDITRWYFANLHGISFGLNPRQIRHVAIGLIMLVLFSEVNILPVIRTRNSAKIVQVARARRVRRNELDLTNLIAA